MFDEKYFEKRGLESKHYLMANSWIDYFRPESVFDYGCGRGVFVSAFRYYEVPAVGFDFAEAAVKNPVEGAEGCLSSEINSFGEKAFDLVVCIDVLEHVPAERLGQALLDIVSKGSKNFLFSICMTGNPDFERDKTHVTKRSKEWWIHFISGFGLEWESTPEHFPFREQHLVFKRRE